MNEDNAFIYICKYQSKAVSTDLLLLLKIFLTEVVFTFFNVHITPRRPNHQVLTWSKTGENGH